MGKGGTRFCGDAVGVRGKAKGYTSKDMKKASAKAPRHRSMLRQAGRGRQHRRSAPAARCHRPPFAPCMQDMEAFLATGVHPEVERARKAQQDIIPPLPERSTQRQHVFLDIAVAGRTRGGHAPPAKRCRTC